MKDFIKFMSRVTGIFRSIVTILFMLAIFFTALVDRDLLLAFVDILGFSAVSEALIKPILFVIFGLMFIINFIITRNIFIAGSRGSYHGSNLIFALLFLALNAFVFLSFRQLDNIVSYIFFAFNGLIVINSILGLVARSRGEYEQDLSTVKEDQSKQTFIEFEDDGEDSDDFIVLPEESLDASQNIADRTITADDIIIADPSKNTEIVLETEEDNKDLIKLEKDQKLVFESKKAQAKNTSKKVSQTKEKSDRPKTINRVAKKKSDDRGSQHISSTEATNKIQKNDTISEDEFYEIHTDEIIEDIDKSKN